MLKRIVKLFIPAKTLNSFKQRILKRFEIITVTRPYCIQLLEKGRFANKVVVVTGGSGAIGRAISYRFAAEGAIVYVCGRTINKVQEVVDEIVQSGGVAKPGIIDISDKKSIELFFSGLIEKEHKIDVLVTSAGGSARDMHNVIAEQSPEVISEVIDTNLTGTILCTKYAAQQMIKQQCGKIVTISSTIGTQGKAGFSEYAASKAAVIVYTKSLAMELGKYGVNVNCVSPGIVQRDTISYERMERIKKTNYLMDYGKPEDISNMVSFLASEEASFVTGQNFVVDGGRSLGLKGD